MKKHLCGSFVNHATKTFNTTARPMDEAHLPGMIVGMKERGYDWLVHGERLTRTQAQDMKSCIKGAMLSGGYTYEPRSKNTDDSEEI
jgi:hypothetical protein